MLRFAPSPTGDMHIGNLRVAIFNHIISKQRNEKLIIRIEDTDRERNIDGKEREILELLNKFKIDYSQVVFQSHNIKFHQQIAMKLMMDKKAFACFCPEDILHKKREGAKKAKEAYRYDGACELLNDTEVMENEKPFVVRFKKPTENINFFDGIKGEFEFNPKEIDSFIILRVDKYPTYNFACAVDDMLLDVSVVIRGEDHLSNTPKQIAIRDAMNYDKVIDYIHLPIILGESGKKMSKRDDESSVKWLLEEGFLVEAIENYLILLGNKTPKEIFSIHEAIDFFSVKNISKSPAKFDIDKLKFINREQMKLKDELELSKLLGFADVHIGALAKLYVEEADTIKELKPKIDKFFAPKESKEFKNEIEQLKNILKSKEFETFNDLKSYAMSESGLKGKNLFKPLRFVLTGAFSGPEISKIYPCIKGYLGEIIK